jgi:hypothetical protein
VVKRVIVRAFPQVKAVPVGLTQGHWAVARGCLWPTDLAQLLAAVRYMVGLIPTLDDGAAHRASPGNSAAISL